MALVLTQPAVAADQYLKLTILEGDGAFNDTRRQIGADTVVEVRDERDQLVEGAEVVFTVPSIGAGGAFSGGSNVFKTVTDRTGRARASSFKPNRIDGRFNIKVAAVREDRSGKVVISQTNSAAVQSVGTTGGGAGGGKAKLLIGLISAGASVGLLATRLGGSGSNGGGAPPTPTRPPTTLSVSGISIGGPR